MTDAAAPPIVVGRVRKPHGLKGEISIFPLTDSPDVVFTPGRVIYLLNLSGDMVATVKLESARGYHREWLVKLRDHGKREAVDDFRGLFMAVDRDAVPPLEEGEVYQQELVGFAVRDEAGEPMGLVSAVYDLPGGLTIEVQGREREFLLPFRSEYIRETDRAGRRLVVSVPEGLFE